MERENFMKEIELYINSCDVNDIDRDYIKAKYSKENGKNGIYFLYNEDDVVVYVGMVSNARSTSFYHRMYLHGNGAHKDKDWFRKCKKFRFKKFSAATEKDLRIIERLMIFKTGQPIYNDIGEINCDFDNIANRVKGGEVNG